MSDPTPPPPPPSQPSGPPPGYYRASDGRDYPIPAGHYLGADGQFHPIAPPVSPSVSAPAAPVAAAASSGWRWDAGSILLMAGGGLAAIGAFLPWVELGGLFAKDGIEGDGKITIVLAIAAVVLGAVGISRANKGALIASVISAALIVLIAVIDMVDVASRAGDVGFAIEVTIGIGLYVTLIGGLLGVVGGVLALRPRR